MNRSTLAIVLTTLLSTAACSDDVGNGTVDVTIWGEEYIEEGIPADVFEDGGSATYTKFLISITDVDLSDTARGQAGHLSEGTLFDLVAPGPHTMGAMADVDAVTHDDFGYTVGPVTMNTTVHGSANASDAAMMATAGYAIYVEGSFSVGGATKTFAWGFTEETNYDQCVDVAAGQDLQGVVVVDGGRSQAQLTIHGDHLFYDDLLSPDAVVRAETLAAADADADGEVTMAELDAVKLADIPSSQGPYGVAASDVNDLGAYVRAATRTLGHFNGEGHCDVHGHTE